MDITVTRTLAARQCERPAYCSYPESATTRCSLGRENMFSVLRCTLAFTLLSATTSTTRNDVVVPPTRVHPRTSAVTKPAVVDRICQNSPPQVHARGRNVAPRNCSAPGSMAWFPCSFKHLGNWFHRKACSGKDGHGIIGCGLTMIALPMLEGIIIEAFRSRKSPVPYVCPRELSNFEDFMAASGRTYLDSCHLARFLSPGQCQNKPGRCSIFHDNECMVHWLAKFALHVMSFLDSSAAGQKKHRKLHCWEPELQLAERQFAEPGRWDVDERCISTLQRMIKAMFGAVSRAVHAELQVGYRIQQDRGIGGGQFGVLLEFMPKLYTFALDAMETDFLAPAFERFRKTISKRRQNRHSQKAAFTCKGLKGTRVQARAMVTKFVHLLSINELHYRKFTYKSLVLASTLNLLLPCSISAAFGKQQ